MDKKDIDITPEVAKEINDNLMAVLKEFDYDIEEAREAGVPLKSNLRNRLDKLGLWNSTSIADEYIKIKDRSSKLPRALRDLVETLFDIALAKYVVTHKNNNHGEV